MTPKTWNTVEECEKTFAEMENPIVQEYIGDDNEEYTLTIFSNGKIVNHIAIKRQLGFGGMSRYVEFVHNNELTKITEEIAQIFDLHGSINVEMRKRNENYYVFEINPRISSTIGFRLHLGFNDVSWWIGIFEKRYISIYLPG